MLSTKYLTSTSQNLDQGHARQGETKKLLQSTRDPEDLITKCNTGPGLNPGKETGQDTNVNVWSLFNMCWCSFLGFGLLVIVLCLC